MKNKHMKIKRLPGTLYTMYIDMIKQPHLLIAGTTGSGKTTLVNALIYTATIYSPANAFILLDSKGTELKQYKNMYQCLCYARDIEEQLRGLQHGYKLMMKRYAIMEKNNENIYNGSDLYIIIDEYAHIATSIKKKQCTDIIQRIAQIGRAARVHIWLCTQCTLREILKPAIRVNFDSRIGLRTRSKQDSRNIIDACGLEMLPRYGYGYYMSPDYSGILQLNRYQDKDIQHMIEFYSDRKQCIIKG